MATPHRNAPRRPRKINPPRNSGSPAAAPRRRPTRCPRKLEIIPWTDPDAAASQADAAPRTITLFDVTLSDGRRIGQFLSAATAEGFVRGWNARPIGQQQPATMQPVVFTETIEPPTSPATA